MRTPLKEYTQTVDGLIAQGAKVHRSNKHDTTLQLSNGRLLVIPEIVTDPQTIYAMKAQVKRSGLHWPLDHHDKKETTTMSAAPTSDPDDMPPAVRDTIDSPPAKDRWDVVAPYLTEYADKEFWTEELLDRIPKNTSGFRDRSAGHRRMQQFLWFGGFRVIDRKVNRAGYSYKWARPVNAVWPTTFAMTSEEKMARATAARHGREYVAPGASTTAAGNEPIAGPKPSPATVAAVSRPLTIVPTVTGETADDVELTLAMEQEQRAIRAERNLESVRHQLDTERRDHAATRRDFLVRIAGWEKRAGEKDAEITRLRSLLEERQAERREHGTDLPGLQRRAEGAEAQVISLTERLRDAQHMTRNWEARALKAEQVTPVAEPSDWWPLEPQQGQTISETMDGAKLFGLEVRVQARRKG